MSEIDLHLSDDCNYCIDSDGIHRPASRTNLVAEIGRLRREIARSRREIDRLRESQNVLMSDGGRGG